MDSKRCPAFVLTANKFPQTRFGMVGEKSRCLSQRALLLCITAIIIGNEISLLAIGSVQRSNRAEYNVVGLGLNWIQFGGIRRGLIGSITYILCIKLQYAPFIVYGASCLAFGLMSFFMLRRMTVYAINYIPYLIIFLALLLFWSRDIGRTDMLLGAVFITAALALVDGRIILASLFIAGGALVHEVGAIYGIPLLAAILIDRRRYTYFRLKNLAPAAFIIAASVVIYALILISPRSDNPTIVATILSEDPSIHLDYLTSLAFYDNLGGVRALKTSICTVAGANRFYQLAAALLMIFIAVNSINATRRINWIEPVTASVPPLIFVWASAQDMSRWTTLAILNVWIVSAVRRYAPAEEDGGGRRVWERVIYAAVIVLLLHPKLGYDFYSSPLIQKAIVIAVGPPIYKTQEQCDPNWLSLLSQK
jgi:hypothetical protein